MPVVKYPHNVNVKLRISAEQQRRHLDRTCGPYKARTQTQYAKNRPQAVAFKTDLSLHANMPGKNLCELVTNM